MNLIGTRYLLKPIKKKVLGIEEIDHYEIAHVGDECSAPIKVGDKVFYQMGTKIILLGEEYQMVDEDNIIAVL